MSLASRRGPAVPIGSVSCSTESPVDSALEIQEMLDQLKLYT